MIPRHFPHPREIVHPHPAGFQSIAAPTPPFLASNVGKLLRTLALSHPTVSGWSFAPGQEGVMRAVPMELTSRMQNLAKGQRSRIQDLALGQLSIIGLSPSLAQNLSQWPSSTG